MWHFTSFKTAGENHLPLLFVAMLDFQSQTHSLRELWITLIIQQFTIRPVLVRRTFLASVPAVFPTSTIFSNTIICRILYRKGLLLPQWALAKHTFPVFSPFPSMPIPPSPLQEQNQGLNIFPENQEQTIILQTTSFSLLKRCPPQCFEEPPEMEGQWTSEHA